MSEGSQGDESGLPPKLMTIAELASWLQRSQRQLRDDVRDGRIPAVRIGSALRFDRQAVSTVLGIKGGAL